MFGGRQCLLAATVIAALAWPHIATACTLQKAKSAKAASLVVYFTKFAREDKTGGKYKRCRIVKDAQPDTKKFHVTPFRQDANVVVLRANWPR